MRADGHYAMKFSNVSRALCPVLVVLALQACQTRAYPPLVRAQSVDIPRFMGDWYVIGCIPSVLERHDYNAVESYHQDPAGRILTVFTFNKGSFDGPLKRYTPVGFVTPDTQGYDITQLRKVPHQPPGAAEP